MNAGLVVKLAEDVAFDRRQFMQPIHHDGAIVVGIC
jgi:hypothetical protein